MIRIVQKHFLVHRGNMQVIVIALVICTYIRVNITIAYMITFLIGSLERDQRLDEYYMKQNNIDDTGDFVDKYVKILPPHVEELKRLVSLYEIPYAYIKQKKLIFYI